MCVLGVSYLFCRTGNWKLRPWRLLAVAQQLYILSVSSLAHSAARYVHTKIVMSVFQFSLMDLICYHLWLLEICCWTVRDTVGLCVNDMKIVMFISGLTGQLYTIAYEFVMKRLGHIPNLILPSSCRLLMCVSIILEITGIGQWVLGQLNIWIFSNNFRRRNDDIWVTIDLYDVIITSLSWLLIMLWLKDNCV